jgi:5-methylcytosine-specific restriction endonuclease McrA
MAYNAQYYATHKAERYLAVKKWRAKNAERRRRQLAEYYAENAERLKARARKHRASLLPGSRKKEKTESSRARVSRWQRRNPDKVRANKNARRCRKLGAPGNGVTAQQWKDLQAQYCHRCAYCQIPGVLTLDHIDALSRGGADDDSNAAPACRRCNSSKGDKSLLRWIAERALAASRAA